MQLANSLASMGWYLERRQNEVKGFTEAERHEAESRIGHVLEGHVIKLKEGTQAYVATFMRQPELAKKNPKLMFMGRSDGGYFDRIFSRDLTAEKFVKAQSIAVAVTLFVKEFMKRKRRKERVENWEDDYSEFLGRETVERHGVVLDQVIPQSAIFLIAASFEEAVVLQGKDIDLFISDLTSDGNAMLVNIIDSTIRFAAGDPRWSRSWPTLLKSQSFFENYFSFRRGEIEREN
jgi:hypothetical protein